jgi:hypothetical protein
MGVPQDRSGNVAKEMYLTTAGTRIPIPEGEAHINICSDWALDRSGGEWSVRHPAHVTSCSMDSRLGGCQSRFALFGGDKSVAPSEERTPILQGLDRSLVSKPVLLFRVYNE